MPRIDLSPVAAHIGVMPVSGASATLDRPFDHGGLSALRAAVSAHATALGADAALVEDLVLIAHELVTNAVRHGGGHGRLRLARHGDRIHCEVSDAGPGMVEPDRFGTRQAAHAATGGRGLWIVRRLAGWLDVHTGPDGTTVTAVVTLR
jgi:anti-sigma regulatory factor (Ser/Thr protein kinase)